MRHLSEPLQPLTLLEPLMVIVQALSEYPLCCKAGISVGKFGPDCHDYLYLLKEDRHRHNLPDKEYLT